MSKQATNAVGENPQDAPCPGGQFSERALARMHALHTAAMLMAPEGRTLIYNLAHGKPIHHVGYKGSCLSPTDVASPWRALAWLIVADARRGGRTLADMAAIASVDVDDLRASLLAPDSNRGVIGSTAVALRLTPDARIQIRKLPKGLRAILTAMRRRSLSTAEVGRRSGLSPKTVSQVLNGSRTAEPGTIAKLAIAVGIGA